MFYENNSSDLGIPDRMTTMMEVFRGAGFRTGAVSSSSIVRRSPTVYNSRGGFDQGFEEFDETCKGDQRTPYTAPRPMTAPYPLTCRRIAELD